MARFLDQMNKLETSVTFHMFGKGEFVSNQGERAFSGDREARSNPSSQMLRQRHAPADTHGSLQTESPKADKKVNNPFQFYYSSESVIESIYRVRDGYDISSITSISNRLRISPEKLCRLAEIPHSSNSPESGERKLSPAVSDRLYRIETVFELAVKVLESEEGAVKWLNSPIPSLRNLIPLEMLDTDAGVKLVKDVLLRLEFGLVS